MRQKEQTKRQTDVRDRLQSSTAQNLQKVLRENFDVSESAQIDMAAHI